jgi:hypothetical protein
MKQLLTATPVPAQPRNLAATLHFWFMRLGFAVTREDNYLLTRLDATWLASGGLLYTASYVHHHPEGQDYTALFSLFVRDADGRNQCLISATHIRRAAEVRLLLTANKFYKDSRSAALAAGALQSA